MKKFVVIVLFAFYFSNLFSLEKTVKINDTEIPYSLVLKTLEKLKNFKQDKAAIFYKMVSRCRSNVKDKIGCHKHSCPVEGAIVSKYGLNFHEFDVCRIITQCVKNNGINYNIFNPFELDEDNNVWIYFV